MNEDNLHKLEEELKASLKSISDSGKVHLEQTRRMLDENVKDVINVYSNDIRNITLISGTIAPFSLALLETEKINASIPLLLLGFSLLIINIILAQYYLKKQAWNNDKKLGSAELSLICATTDLWSIESEKELSERTSRIPEYIKNTDAVNNFLGLDSRNMNIQIVRSELRKQTGTINFIFSVGTLCIILSVLINPLIEFIVRL